MKRIIAICLTALLLLTSCGGQAIPSAEQEQLQIEDVFANGVKWGNRLAAEQGDWVALRGIHEGKTGLMLYHKNDETASFLLEGEVCNIGLLGNQIYYQFEGETPLYRIELATKKSGQLLGDCAAYQVRQDRLYYLTTAHKGRLEYLDFELGFPRTMETDFAVDDFWLTDSGLYYRNEERGLLRFIPHDSSIEQLIYQSYEVTVRDVVAVEGEQIAFLAVGKEGSAALMSYDPATKKAQEHLLLGGTHLNFADGHAVTVEGGHIYAADLNTDKLYDWGAVAEHQTPQLLSDCVILYREGQPVFQYYPKK